jgi:lipoyl(octanoyl) transferase
MAFPTSWKASAQMAEAIVMSNPPPFRMPVWERSSGHIPYPDALARMEALVEEIGRGEAAERIWLLEHPPLYTSGTSSDPKELIDPRFPVFKAGRGGRYTYHGPGQRVGYVMLNLKQRGQDVRAFVHALEQWVIGALGEFGLACWSVEGRVGIWTMDQGQEAKIGAIGVRVRRWVTFHGFSVNISPDLSHFGGIIPCGLPDFPVTSLAKLGITADMARFDAALERNLPHFLNALG